MNVDYAKNIEQVFTDVMLHLCETRDPADPVLLSIRSYERARFVCKLAWNLGMDLPAFKNSRIVKRYVG